MIYAILICHGRLAESLVNAAQGIVGHREGLFPFTNTRVETEMLKDRLQQLIDRSPGDRPLVFVDLWGGSCWRVGMQICHQNPGVELISGVSLPMLVTFLSYRDRLDYLALVEKLVGDTRKSVRTSGMVSRNGTA